MSFIDTLGEATAPEAAVPAFELKFLVGEGLATEVERWASAHFQLDPHGDPSLGGAYQTTSLYFDTPEHDVFHRSPSFKRKKFRIRRYGCAPIAFLERKSKRGDRVAKKRTSLPGEEVAQLACPMSLMTWSGHWFHRRLLARRLAPACRISYRRRAFVGSCPESPLRLTLDRRLIGVLTSDWNLDSLEAGLPLLQGEVILELKFHHALPGPFKELIRDFNLSPRSVSKYRLCREAWNAAEPFREVADA